MKLTDAEKVGMSPDEVALLEGGNAEELLAMTGTTEPAAETPGEGEGAENEGSTTDAAGKVTSEAAAPAAPEGGDAALSTEELQAALTEAEPQATPAPKPYTVPDTDFSKQRADLLAEKKEVEKKWAAGDLSDDERADQIIELDAKLLDVVQEHTRAQTLREANEQAAKQAEQAKIDAENTAITALIKKDATANAGKPLLNYAADAEAQADFDAMFAAINRRPDAATKTAEQRVADAHKRVLALRGITVAAAPAAPATPAPKLPRDVPVTLSGLPNAGHGDVKDDLLTQAGKLQGEDLERWLASQPVGTVDRLMRMADNPVH